jgi:Tol biopolymer transport system component
MLFISGKRVTPDIYDNPQLFSMNEDGSHIVQITKDAGFPIYDAAWSLDGEKIALTSSVGGVALYGPTIYVMNARDTDKYLLTKTEKAGCYFATGSHPVWSPDSRQIAFTRLLIPEIMANYDIFITNADGSNEHQLTPSSNDGAERVTDWARDGSSLLGDVPSVVTDSGDIGVPNTRIAFFNLQGNYIRLFGQLGLTYKHPIYSTQGDKIAFVSSKMGYESIYIMNSSCTGETLLTTSDYDFYEPVSWSPNDEKILYNAGNWSSHENILIIDIQTLAIVNITPFNPDSTFSYAVSWRKR